MHSSSKMNIFVFINDSKGELDWIAPFLNDKLLNDCSIDIYMHNIESNEEKLQAIIEDYNLNKNNINILKFDKMIYKLFKIYDSIFARLLARFKDKNLLLYYIFNWIYSLSLKFISLFNISNKKYDFIFRDYNLRDSTILNNIIESNPKAKIIIFPHAFGIQRLPKWAKLRTPQKKVRCNLYLENTAMSTRAFEIYHDSFFASGAPILSLNYDKESLFSLDTKNVLILLRDGYEQYGCSNEEALKIFKNSLVFLNKNNYKTFIKIHPRKSYLKEQFLNEINIYNNVQLYNESLISLNKKFIFCLTFFSTAGLFLTSQQIPVFDITKYRDCNNPKIEGSLTHFCYEGKLIHYLIYFGIQDTIDNLDKLLDKQYLKITAQKQYLKMKYYYPNNSNQKIYDKLKELGKDEYN